MSNINNICKFNLSLLSPSSLSSSLECEKCNHAVWSVIWNFWLIRFPRHSAIAVDCLFRFSALRLIKENCSLIVISSGTIWISKSAYITYKSFTKCLVILDSCESVPLASLTQNHGILCSRSNLTIIFMRLFKYLSTIQLCL